MKIEIPEYGNVVVNDEQLKREGDCYTRNIEECIGSNFTMVNIGNDDVYICCFENRCGLYSFLANHTMLGAYFGDFEELYCPGLDFYCWAVDECGDDYLEDVGWFVETLDVLITEKYIYRITKNDAEIYVINSLSKLREMATNDALVKRINSVLSDLFEECLKEIITDNDDIYNYDFGEWADDLIKKAGLK